MTRDRNADGRRDGSTAHPQDDDNDRAAQALREELMEAATDAAVRAQRIGEALETAGIDEELVRGTGDLIYGAVVQQLLLGARVLRRSQELGERLARGAAHRSVQGARRLVCLRVKPGEQTSRLEEVKSPLPYATTLELTWSTSKETGSLEELLRVRSARTELDALASTSLMLEVGAPADAAPGVHTGRIEASVRRGSDAPLPVLLLDVEIWVTAS